MLNLKNFMTKESMSVARSGNVDDCMNRSRQQLENTFTMPSVSIPTPILISRPTPRPTIRFPLNPIPRLRCLFEPLKLDVDKS